MPNPFAALASDSSTNNSSKSSSSKKSSVKSKSSRSSSSNKSLFRTKSPRTQAPKSTKPIKTQRRGKTEKLDLAGPVPTSIPKCTGEKSGQTPCCDVRGNGGDSCHFLLEGTAREGGSINREYHRLEDVFKSKGRIYSIIIRIGDRAEIPDVRTAIISLINSSTFDQSLKLLKDIAKLRYHYLQFLKDKCKSSDVKCSDHNSEFRRYLNIINNIYIFKKNKTPYLNSSTMTADINLWNKEFVTKSANITEYKRVLDERKNKLGGKPVKSKRRTSSKSKQTSKPRRRTNRRPKRYLKKK